MKDGISGATPSNRADVRYEKNLAKIREAQAARTQEIKAKMAEWKRAATATPQATTAPTLQDLQAQFEQQEEAKFESGVVEEDEAREEEQSLEPLRVEEQSLEQDKANRMVANDLKGQSA